MHVSNNEKMAFNYTEVLVSHSFNYSSKRGPTKILLVKGTAHWNRKPFGLSTSYSVISNPAITSVDIDVDL